VKIAPVIYCLAQRACQAGNYAPIDILAAIASRISRVLTSLLEWVRLGTGQRIRMHRSAISNPCARDR